MKLGCTRCGHPVNELHEPCIPTQDYLDKMEEALKPMKQEWAGAIIAGVASTVAASLIVAGIILIWTNV